MRPIGMLPTDRFAAACVYPGKLDEQAVERELAAFLQALGMRRRIVRLRAGWRLQDEPPLNRDIEWILAERIKRNLGVRAFRAVLAQFRAAGRVSAAIRGHAGVRFALDDRRTRAARRASDAGAADAALVVLDQRADAAPKRHREPVLLAWRHGAGVRNPKTRLDHDCSH